MHSTGDRDSLAFICLSRKPVGASASSKTQEITKNIKNQRAFENNIRSFRGNHDLHLQFLLPLPLPMFVLYASYLSIHCMGWFPINWINQLDDELLTNLYISEKCERRNSPNFRDVPGRALFRHGLTEVSVALAVGSARPRWCHGGWDPRRLRSGGEETISISRWVVELISRGVVQVKNSDSAISRARLTWLSIFVALHIRNGWVGNKLRSTIFLENSRCC